MAKTKKSFFTRIGDWFRGMKSELKKVVWPTPKQTMNNTLVVIVSIVVSAIVIGAVDLLASSFVDVLINLFT
jgi:preprotein translocase subunit SecE